jgi:hypothetical protein
MDIDSNTIPINFYESPKITNSTTFIKTIRKRTNQNIKNNKSKQKLYIYEGKEVPGTEYLDKNVVINQGNRFNKPSFQNLQQPTYGQLSDNELASLTRYTRKGDVYINSFLKNTDTLELYLYSLKAKFYEDLKFILDSYDIKPYLTNLLSTKQCIELNTNDLNQSSGTKPPTEHEITRFIEFRYINFLFFKLIYNSLAKSPKKHEPFKVLRGTHCHYLSEDPTKIFYLTSFLSTTMTYSVAESFGKLDKRSCRNFPETPIYNNNGKPTGQFKQDDREYTNLYVFYVHPQCNYISISGISEYSGEDEVLIAPYSRYNFIKKEQYVYNKKIRGFQTNEVVIRKYYYAIFPTDLTIPNDFCEFLTWRNTLLSSPGNINAPPEENSLQEYMPPTKKRGFFSGLFGKRGGTRKMKYFQSKLTRKSLKRSK